MKRPTGMTGMVLALVAVMVTPRTPVSAQSGSEQAEFVVPASILALRLPNGAPKSLLSPTGWGAAYNTIFMGAGYQYETPFTEAASGSLGFGLGLGDPVRYVGLHGTLSVLKPLELGFFTLSGKVHRYLGTGFSLALGVETLYSTRVAEGFGQKPEPAFYGVLSHVFQEVDGAVGGTGKLHLSLGAGTGRFSELPFRARQELDVTRGTYVFANAAVELAENWNLIGEWDGVGLNAGMSYALPFPFLSFSAAAGIADLTGYSSERPRLIGGGGLAFSPF